MRKNAEISAGSMADIAFLLLMFFLVATTIDIDTGIARKLPYPDDSPNPPPIKKRNLMVVNINKNNELMVNEKHFDIRNLREKAKEFILNENNNKNLPELYEFNIPQFGNVKSTKKHVISLQNDRGTSYDMYLKVQNELVAAYNELRNEYALKKLRTNYTDLSKTYQKAIREIYPNHISEAEPRDVSQNIHE